MVEPPGPPPPPELPPEPPPPLVEPPLPDPSLCPRCGSPRDAFQEYCLECGIRLPPPPGVPSVRTTTVWSRESPLWLWAALAALLLVALIAGAIVAIAATDEKAGRASSIPVVSTNPTTTNTVGVITQPPTFTINPGTTTTAPTTTTLPTTTQATTTTTATTTGALTTWPPGKDGFTIVLRSVPKSEGRGPAEAEARRAMSRGLPQVGVLDSSDYSSMVAGYYVVFSGVYDTKAQAQNRLQTARSSYPLAYVRQVAD
jgi:hypothetical protein